MTAISIINSILLGAGLAMDAFSVSVVNGICEPGMRKRKACLVAGTYAFFQFLMPMTGWLIAATMLNAFSVLGKIFPYLSLILLTIIGVKMIAESRKAPDGCSCKGKLRLPVLLGQGIATSIDALSVGLTLSTYAPVPALEASLIIAVVTFVICLPGVIIGRKIGTKLSSRATFVGGLVLIAVGAEIFIRGI